jgi:hypothetical protein
MKGAAMNLKLQHAELHLEPSQIIRLRDAAGARVRVLHGLLWVTQHRDGRDHIVPSGRTVTLDRAGLTLLHALEPTEVDLSDPAPGPGWQQRVGQGLAAVLRSVGKGIARSFGPGAIEAYRPGKWHYGL